MEYLFLTAFDFMQVQPAILHMKSDDKSKMTESEDAYGIPYGKGLHWRNSGTC